jgi:hypothetical protein
MEGITGRSVMADCHLSANDVSGPRLDETREIGGLFPSLEARAGIEPTYKDLQSSA